MPYYKKNENENMVSLFPLRVVPDAHPSIHHFLQQTDGGHPKVSSYKEGKSDASTDIAE